MNGNINLGSFEWDTAKIDHQIGANIQQITKLSEANKALKRTLEESTKSMKDLEDKIEEQHKEQAKLTKEKEEGLIVEEDYAKAMKTSKESIKNLTIEKNNYAKAQAQAIIQTNKNAQEIKELKSENASLNKLLSAGVTEVESQTNAYKNMSDNLKNLKSEFRDIAAQMANMEKAGEKESEAYQQLSQRYNVLGKEIKETDATLKEIDKSMGEHFRNVGNYKDAVSDLVGKLSGFKAEAKDVSAEMAELIKRGEQSSEAYRQLEQRLETLNKSVDETKDAIKEMNSSMSEEIQGAAGQLVGGLGELANGNIAGGVNTLTMSFGALKNSITGLTASLLSNPLTATLVAVTAVATGVGLAVKEFFDYNKEVTRLNTEVESLTNRTGEVANQIRLNATAISNAYEKDQTEAIKEMNSLMQDFGISAEEAFKIYNKGMADGGATNSKFGDSIREYGVLMQQNGYSAEEFVNLLNAGVDLDIYTDKLPDAIKEAGLSLTENTKATRDALTNAFGASFSEDILSRVETGQTSVKDALVEIAKKAKEADLTLQQQAQLTADVFRGAGEDAGGALKVFEAINLAHEKEKQQLQGLARHTSEMTELQKELAIAKDEALKSDGIISFTQSMEKLWVKAQIVWYGLVDAITEAIQWVDDVTGASDVLVETWEVVSSTASSLWDLVKELANTFSDLLSVFGSNTSETKNYVREVLKAFNPLTKIKLLFAAVGEVVRTLISVLSSARVNISAFVTTAKNLFSVLSSAWQSVKNLDFNAALDKMKSFSIAKAFSEAKKEGQGLKNIMDAIAASKNSNTPAPKAPAPSGNKPSNNKQGTLYDREAQAKAEEEARKRAEADAKKAHSKAEADAKKAVTDKQKQIKEAEKEAKEEAKRYVELQKEKAQQAVALAKSELAEYIRINAEKYKDDKRWTDEKLKHQIAYNKEVERRQLDILNKEKQAKEESIKTKLDELKQKEEALAKHHKTLSAIEILEKENLNEALKIIATDHGNAVAQIEADTRDKIKADENAFEEQKQEDKKLAQSIAFQQKIIDLEMQGASEFEIKREQARQDYEAGKAELDEKLANKIITEEQYEEQLLLLNEKRAQDEKDVDEAVLNAKLEGFATVFGQAKSLFGEHTAMGKASAIAETTINTYQSATAAYKAMAGIPVVGPALAAASAALAVASGLKSVQKIMAVKPPKAQRGMYIRGKSHAMGGVPISTPNGMIEAEGGEVIINKTSSLLFRDLLSDINVAGGGVRFAQGGVVGSNLSTVQRSLMPKNQTITLGNEAINAIAGAIYSGSQRGLSDLSENNKIRQGANF